MNAKTLALLLLSASLPGAASAATNSGQIVGPGAVEVNDSGDAPELHGDFPESCMVESATMRCSATIISKTQAITAAHCAEGATSKPVNLTCGGNRVHYKGTLRPNGAYVYGAGLTQGNLENDYGFITLTPGRGKKGVKEFNAEPMPFASSGQWGLFSNEARNDCRLAGWGVNNEGTDSRLFMAAVPHISYSDESSKILIVGTNGTNENGAAHGDSGGSLICSYNGNWVLVGVITSTGRNNVTGAVNVMDWGY